MAKEKAKLSVPKMTLLARCGGCGGLLHSGFAICQKTPHFQ